MHNGAFNDLEAVIRHHLDPAMSLDAYDPDQLEPALVRTYRLDPELRAALLQGLAPDLPLSWAPEAGDIDALLAFLSALESASVDTSTPQTTPSGLPVPACPSGEIAP